MGAAAVPVIVASTAASVASMYYQNKQQKKAEEAIREQQNKPVPVQTPPPSPTNTNPQLNEQQRLRKLAQMRMGFQSTIGGTSSGFKPTNITSPSLMPIALKTRLGQ